MMLFRTLVVKSVPKQGEKISHREGGKFVAGSEKNSVAVFSEVAYAEDNR